MFLNLKPHTHLLSFHNPQNTTNFFYNILIVIYNHYFYEYIFESATI